MIPPLRIDGTHRSQGIGKTGAAGRTGAGADFVPSSGVAASRIGAGSPIMGMTGIDAILALQAVGGPLEGRKRSVRRGRSMLDLLDQMQSDLLIGRVSAERLDQMAVLLSEVRERSLPALDALLDDIELRLRVELAKVGRFPAF